MVYGWHHNAVVLLNGKVGIISREIDSNSSFKTAIACFFGWHHNAIVLLNGKVGITSHEIDSNSLLKTAIACFLGGIIMQSYS